MNTSRRTGMLSRLGPLVLFTLAIMLAATPAATAQTPVPADSLRTISVSGMGRVSASPDTASVMFGIESRNEALAVAQDEVTANTETLTAMLLEKGIAQDDILTASYDVFPVNEYDRNGNFVGIDHYQVTLNLSVTVRDLDLVGTLLDEGVTSGATYVGGISFYVEDPGPYMNEAREAAVNDARVKADQYAQLSGAVITGVFSIEETSAPMPAAQQFDMMEASDAEASSEVARSVPVSPGQTEIIVMIDVVYTIEPGNG
jgi:uncharacterized protein YggE